MKEELAKLRKDIRVSNQCEEDDSIELPFVEAAGSDLAWAGRILNPKAVAAPIHELVVPTRHAPRLADLTQEEELALWELVDKRVAKVLEEDGVSAVTILINDGPPAGQTVGHVHFHVLGINKSDLVENLGGNFDRLTMQYSQEAVAPLEQARIKTSDLSELADSLRRFREERDPDNNLGFSVMTGTQKQTSDDEYDITVQSWSADAARPFGLTNLIRVLNDYRDEPYSWPVAHLEQHFTPTKYEAG